MAVLADCRDDGTAVGNTSFLSDFCLQMDFCSGFFCRCRYCEFSGALFEGACRRPADECFCRDVSDIYSGGFICIFFGIVFCFVLCRCFIWSLSAVFFPAFREPNSPLSSASADGDSRC